MAASRIANVLLHHCYKLHIDFVTVLWYVPDFGTGSVKNDFVAEGGHQQEPEGQHEVHVRVPPGQVP